MRKEAIIGLTVILALTITFGVVLARRLGDSPERAVAPSEQRSGEDSDVAADTAGKADATRHTATAKPTELRILAAKPADDEPKRLSPTAIDRFATTKVKVDEPAASARVVDVPPAPMMPKPTASTWAGAGDHQAEDVRQSVGSRPSPLRPIDATRTSASQPYDPFPTPPSPPATTYAGQANYTPAGFQAPDVSVPNPHHSAASYGDAGSADYSSVSGYSGEAGYSGASSRPGPAGYSGASGYAQTGAATQAPSPWQQSSPSSYAPIPSQQASIPSRPGPSQNLGTSYDVRSARNANGDYEVQPNENYWAISEKLYGSGAYFKALAEHNREKFPQEDQLDVGDVILAPTVIELERAYPDLCPKPSRRETVRSRGSLVSTPAVYGRRTYVVEEGDTLFDIARYELGKASRWVEILELNRDLVGDDPGYIVPGMTLALPGDVEPTDRLTQRPRTPYNPYQQETVPQYH